MMVKSAWAQELLKGIDEAEVLANLERSTEDSNWINSNMTTLLQDFPDKFVAVYDKQLVGHADALEDVIQIATNKGFNPNHCTIKVIEIEDYILSAPEFL